MKILKLVRKINLIWPFLVLVLTALYLENDNIRKFDVIYFNMILGAILIFNSKSADLTARPAIRVLAGIVGVLFVVAFVGGIYQEGTSSHHILSYIGHITFTFIFLKLAIDGYIFKVEEKKD